MVVVLVGLGLVASACSSSSEGQATTTRTSDHHRGVVDDRGDDDDHRSADDVVVHHDHGGRDDDIDVDDDDHDDRAAASHRRHDHHAPPRRPPGRPTRRCIYTIAPGDSLNAIVTNLGNPDLSVDAVALENGIGDPNVINAGDPIDVCPGNGIDDITGALRAPPDTTPEPEPETDGAAGSDDAGHRRSRHARCRPASRPSRRSSTSCSPTRACRR